MPDRSVAAVRNPGRLNRRCPGRRGFRSRLAQTLPIVVLTMIACACGKGKASSGTAETHSAPPPPAAPMPASCQQRNCHVKQTVALPGGYTATLWLGSDQQDYQSRPVIELLWHAAAVQWWISPVGDGWNGSLTCDTSAAEPNCVLVDSVGMHASVAEMLIFRDERLAHPTGAVATTNSAGMSAGDLNGDGYLDVIGSVNDYRPNYAQGHNYWQTFQYRDDRLVLTGCASQSRGSTAPRQLLSGACPVVAR
jgi:hypothetical protein